MGDQDMDAEFVLAGRHLAKLSVENASPGVSVSSSGEPPAHLFAWPGGTATLVQQYDPDAAWELRGPAVSVGMAPTVADWSMASWANDFVAFAAGSGVESQGHAVTLLPSGDYWVVRTVLGPAAVPETLLGNRYVPAPAGVSALRGPLDTAISAMVPTPAPGLYVAAVFLEPTGDPGIEALFLAPLAASPDAGDGSSIVILPADSSLVVSARWGSAYAKDRDEMLRTFRQQRAEAIARRWLALPDR